MYALLRLKCVKCALLSLRYNSNHFVYTIHYLASYY